MPNRTFLWRMGQIYGINESWQWRIHQNHHQIFNVVKWFSLIKWMIYEPSVFQKFPTSELSTHLTKNLMIEKNKTWLFSNFESFGHITCVKTVLSDESYSRFDFPAVSKSMVLPQVTLFVNSLNLPESTSVFSFISDW